MKRNMLAVMFFAVMAMLIALKHPVLGYCLCIDSYYAGDCVCAVDTPTTATSSCPSSCSTCPSTCSTYETSTGQDADSPAPCSDCTQVLLVNVGDFVWHASDDIPSDSATPLTSPEYDLCSKPLPMASQHSTIRNRGDPPPDLLSGTPLYLRNLVLRL
jgi:hypothetical protein